MSYNFSILVVQAIFTKGAVLKQIAVYKMMSYENCLFSGTYHGCSMDRRDGVHDESWDTYKRVADQPVKLCNDKLCQVDLSQPMKKETNLCAQKQRLLELMYTSLKVLKNWKHTFMQFGLTL